MNVKTAIWTGFIMVFAGFLYAGAQTPPAAPSQTEQRVGLSTPTAGSEVQTSTNSAVTLTQTTIVTSDPFLDKIDAQIVKGEWKESRSELLAYLKKNGRSAPAWTLLGRTCLSQGRPKEALGKFRKALKMNPQYAVAYHWSGVAFESLGRWDEAANEYQAAMKSDPSLDLSSAAWQRIQSHLSQANP